MIDTAKEDFIAVVGAGGLATLAAVAWAVFHNPDNNKNIQPFTGNFNAISPNDPAVYSKVVKRVYADQGIEISGQYFHFDR